MSGRITPSLESFRAVYAYMLADWCREDSLAEFDRLVDRVCREAKIKALRELARSIDPDAIATECLSNEEYWAAYNAASDIQKAALERADQLEQEGRKER